MDTARVRTRTIWMAAAIVFAVGVLASLISGSVIVAVLLLLVAIGCVVAARRVPPEADGRTGDEAEEEDGDEEQDRGGKEDRGGGDGHEDNGERDADDERHDERKGE